MGIVITKPANGAISAGKFSQDTKTYNKTVCKLTLTSCVIGKLMNFLQVGFTL